jgi:ABC-type transport system involved in multi-copper enzyme maturation permease subunit
MRIDQNPLFRKSISPWYDCEAVCIAIVIFMLIVFVFGCIGISVARQEAQFNGYVWIAVLLVVMSGVVILSTIIRLVKKHTRRAS